MRRDKIDKFRHLDKNWIQILHAKTDVEIYQLIKWSIMCIFDSLRPSDAYIRQ